MEIYARNLFRILRESLIRVKEIRVTRQFTMQMMFTSCNEKKRDLN